MEYSAGSVSKLFWYIETKETVKLLKDKSIDEVKNLDDGVKVNYAKFQGIEVGGEGEKKQTIDLLSKI